ncbi:hypothetical protein EV424DRAFT_1640965 [Suillus variegatus]|nr:hypothetical protein EV424DRAFT_1640965 [Suillus variegatus]
MATDPSSVANQRVVDTLAVRLRRRQVVGSRETALETVLVLRQVISKARFSNIDQLVEIIRSVGRKLVEAQPKGSPPFMFYIVWHLITLNRRQTIRSGTPCGKCYIISGRNTTLLRKGQPRKQNVPQKTTLNESHDMLKENDADDPDAFARTLVLMEAIQDVLDELETVHDNISKNAKDHIHSDEIILTIGKSSTVEAFLKAAAPYRKYTVIVADTAPSYGGHDMAQSLSSAGISTVLVPDSSIYALMSRINKVMIGAHAILANGGMFAITGSLLVATAARAHSTPVVVCAGQFKLTPQWNLYHEYGALDFADPSSVLGFEEGNLVDKVDVVNPFYDYVRPELIDAFITNDGDHPPSSVYRLINYEL